MVRISRMRRVRQRHASRITVTGAAGRQNAARLDGIEHADGRGSGANRPAAHFHRKLLIRMQDCARNYRSSPPVEPLSLVACGPWRANTTPPDAVWHEEPRASSSAARTGSPTARNPPDQSVPSSPLPSAERKHNRTPAKSPVMGAPPRGMLARLTCEALTVNRHLR